MLDGAYNVVKSFERTIRRTIKRGGNDALPPDAHSLFGPIYEACRPYTMTGALRMHALFDALRYVTSADIAGDIVECGVWRGGSAMVAALATLRLGAAPRDIWLFDTFEGMPEPTERDVTLDGKPARARWQRGRRGNGRRGDGNDWCFAPLADVRANVARTGYPQQHLHFVQGQVEQTIPTSAPQRIAILRLDTDWYDSTYHELTHLYPRLSVGGVIIIDDYDTWDGARQATDQYFGEIGRAPLLSRIDGAGRVGVKCFSETVAVP